jgi:2-hydroxy-3-keto-5-methylthiopentenyl-1-phosphate phosphatase
MTKPIIAILYDFDKTLSTKDMQEYSFIPNLGMKPEEFWDEVGALTKSEKMDGILAYMYTMIKKSKEKSKPIHRKEFVSLGKHIQYYPGVEDWFGNINAIGEASGAKIEHYIISSGLKEVIEGSKIAKAFKEIFACEFYYEENDVAIWPKSIVNYTTKTQHLFRINKRVLDLSMDDELNKYTPEDERPIPFRNMIYIGDGLTDVPSMKLVKMNGGKSIAVYPERDSSAKQTAFELLKASRVDFVLKANYKAGKELETTVADIISKMVADDKLIAFSKKQANAAK